MQLKKHTSMFFDDCYTNASHLMSKYFSHFMTFVSVLIFSSPVYCMKVINDNLIATGDDNGCVKVKSPTGLSISIILQPTKTVSYSRGRCPGYF